MHYYSPCLSEVSNPKIKVVKEGASITYLKTLMPRANIFVIDPKLWFKVASGEEFDVRNQTSVVALETIPFPVIWLEVERAHLMRWCAEGQPENKMVGVLLWETAPGQVRGVGVVFSEMAILGNILPQRIIEFLCNSLHKTLRTGRTGEEGVNFPVWGPHPLGVGKRCYRRISSICRVVPKKNYLQTKSLALNLRGSINWSHAWEVRGHWREHLTSLGKNRAGEYCVEGFTWVNPHERGEGALIKKTRKVTNGLPLGPA